MGKTKSRASLIKELVVNAFSMLQSSILLGQTNAKLVFVLSRHSIGFVDSSQRDMEPATTWVVGKLDSDKLVSQGFKKSNKILGLLQGSDDTIFYPTDINNFLSLAPLDAILSIKFGKTIVFRAS